MTPAITLLNELGIEYQVHQYQHDPGTESYGIEAVEKLGVAAERVFKTLLVESNDSGMAVAVIPVTQQLQLKSVARVLGCKKVAMARPETVQRSTGYIIGGVSPLGQTQQHPTIIDDSAQAQPSIFISAGRRGVELEILPQRLAEACAARFAPLTKSES